MNRPSWTEERVALLRELFEQDCSASVIANRMGISRNSVIGKLHRLGLGKVKEIKTEEELLAIADKRREQHNEGKRRLYAERQGEQGVRPTIEAEAPAFQGYLGIPFGDLDPFSHKRPNQCRYMAAEEPGPDYRVCGNETAAGQAWCAHCKTIVHDYRKPTEAEQARLRNLSKRARAANAGSAA